MAIALISDTWNKANFCCYFVRFICVLC